MKQLSVIQTGLIPVRSLTVWHYLYSGGYNYTIRKWDEKGSCIAIFKGHTDYVNCLTVWNNYLYSGGYDGTIRKWDETGNSIAIFKGHSYAVNCLTVWNNHLYSGSDDEIIRKWDEKGSCIAIFKGHTSSVRCLTVWHYLYSGRHDGTISKWGEFQYQDYYGLTDEKKKEVLMWEMVGRQLGLSKDIRLLVMRCLI